MDFRFADLKKKPKMFMKLGHVILTLRGYDPQPRNSQNQGIPLSAVSL